MINETLIPKLGVITDIRQDTPDIKTFRVVSPEGKKLFEHRPGQCAMVSIPGVGEAMFSITSSPTNTEYMEFSIKKCGCLTTWLHACEVGQNVTVRGPYGNPFPVDDVFAGKDLLFVAGGVGLAPLRSVINYCRHYRDRYGKIDIVYGSRSKDDLLDYQEIINEWSTDSGVKRFRCWDSCMYSNFTLMAHGNSRNSQKERFRQRFMHKLVYYPDNNDGMFSCVGCGRCLAKCPISMNIVKVMKTLGGKEND